ncbi:MULTISPECIES: condensation domain-containing protein [unclassified Streptomyces]|uniref:condensation domain-containing protein n=1 Tax=unclassified Streptomyces TaxID=2593676 RepID=UPI00336A0538
MGERLALSAAQTSVWVAQQLDSDDRSFNIAEYCEIRGALHPELFEKAVREVVAETEALRTRFEIDEAGLGQFIDDSVEWSMHRFDVADEPDPEAAARKWMAGDLAREFDTAKGPVFSSALFRIGPELFYWYRAVHHVAIDGFALSLIASRVADVYTELVTGRPRQPLPPASLRHVVEDDARYQSSEDYETDRRFWLDRLAGLPGPVSLVEWKPTATRRFVRAGHQLTAEEVDRLRALARRLEVTWPEVVIAAVAVYLHRATQSQDVVLGLPVSGRLNPLLRRIPSMLTNSVPLRLRLDPDTPLGTVIDRTAREVELAREHQRYPHERLLRELPDFPDGRRQFGVDVNIMAFNYSFDYAGCQARTHNLCAGPVEDLSVNVYDRLDGSGLRIDFDGNAELHSPAELADHLARFVALLRSCSEEGAERPIGALPLEVR